MDLTKVDSNFASVGTNGAPMDWYSSHDSRFSVHGVYYDELDGLYRRLPEEVAKAANPDILGLVKMTAGGRLRFVTDSKSMAIKAVIPGFKPMPHMSITGSHGFSVYTDGVFRNRFSPVFQDFKEISGSNAFGESICFEEKKTIEGPAGNHLVELYFPLYGGVRELWIGLEPGSVVESAPSYQHQKPMLFYGSSITQGGCVSRPGNDFLSILARKLDVDYINLGFSGSGNGEDAMIEYITSIDASLYAFDYNMYPNKKERVLPPHYSVYERIRNKHPHAGIFMYDKPGCDYEPYPERETLIYESYQKALASGDKRVYYLSARELFGEGDRDCCMNDVSHPNDLGALRMANAMYSVLKNAFD
ncbi:MAG: hypothetical protein E7399_03595 [Ruminococcaceae bacterium]|nr:hypothetical protein [Oscillospiraceae bacterium]